MEENRPEEEQGLVFGTGFWASTEDLPDGCYLESGNLNSCLLLVYDLSNDHENVREYVLSHVHPGPELRSRERAGKWKDILKHMSKEILGPGAGKSISPRIVYLHSSETEYWKTAFEKSGTQFQTFDFGHGYVRLLKNGECQVISRDDDDEQTKLEQEDRFYAHTQAWYHLDALYTRSFKLPRVLPGNSLEDVRNVLRLDECKIPRNVKDLDVQKFVKMWEFALSDQ
jgi:hypothetical protein